MAEPTDPSATPVPVPPGTTTSGTINQITVRRRMPELAAVCYDGSNAVQVSGWLIARGQACTVAMQPGVAPVLLTPDYRVVPQGWILPNLETISDQELGTVYEQVPAPA